MDLQSIHFNFFKFILFFNVFNTFKASDRASDIDVSVPLEGL